MKPRWMLPAAWALVPIISAGYALSLDWLIGTLAVIAGSGGAITVLLVFRAFRADLLEQECECCNGENHEG